MDDINEQWISSEKVVDDNAVFIEYKPSEALKKLKDIGQLSYAERKTYTQHLSELLEIIGKQVTPILNDSLKQLSDDSDEIKMALLKQIPDILKFLQKYEDGYEQIKEIILHPIFDMLNNPNIDIKEEAGKKLSETAGILTQDDRGKYILRKVLEMAHDDKNEENRIVAVQLLSKLAESFGKDLCDQFVGLEFLSLGDDPQIRVRREAVVNLPVISRICSKEFYKTRLLPFYQKKCQEHIWGMRKACVEIIVSLSEISEIPDRSEVLSQILTSQFLEDQNKWVKVAAYKALGPFIATMVDQKEQLNEKLFHFFNKMTEHSINYLSNNNEIMISCSFYFPAVLLTFGERRWPELKNTLYVLIKNKNKNVRKPIACGLHEVAKIIKQERAENDLFEVYEQVLKDPSDDVKFGAIKHLASFLEIFDKEKREGLVEVLQTVQKDPKKWRVRQLIAKQIGKLTKIYSPDIIFQYIMPIATKLCNDNVNIVREQASRKMYSLVRALYKDEQYGMIIVEIIKGFSFSDKYSQRQVFVMICEKLMKDPQIFEENFLETFEKMSRDKVVGVRISVAKVMVKHFLNDGKLKNNTVILQILEELKKDSSLEIQRQLSYLTDDGNEEDEEEEQEQEEEEEEDEQQKEQEQPQEQEQQKEQEQVEEQKQEEEQQNQEQEEEQQQNQEKQNEEQTEQDNQQENNLKEEEQTQEQVEEQTQEQVQEQQQQEKQTEEEAQPQEQKEDKQTEEQQSQEQKEEEEQQQEKQNEEEQTQQTQSEQPQEQAQEEQPQEQAQEEQPQEKAQEEQPQKQTQEEQPQEEKTEEQAQEQPQEEKTEEQSQEQPQEEQPQEQAQDEKTEEQSQEQVQEEQSQEKTEEESQEQSQEEQPQEQAQEEQAQEEKTEEQSQEQVQEEQSQEQAQEQSQEEEKTEEQAQEEQSQEQAQEKYQEEQPQEKQNEAQAEEEQTQEKQQQEEDKQEIQEEENQQNKEEEQQQKQNEEQDDDDNNKEETQKNENEEQKQEEEELI